MYEEEFNNTFSMYFYLCTYTGYPLKLRSGFSVCICTEEIAVSKMKAIHRKKYV